MSVRRKSGLAIPGLLAALLLALTGVALVMNSAATAAPDASMTAKPDAGKVARGHYLTRAGDCAACHTTQGGPIFAGNRAIATPFGTIYSSNLTPDRKTGIGAWSEDEFWRALHHGKAPGGKLLYPAFPFPSYTHVTRADANAIFAYLRTLKPVHNTVGEPDLSFPLGWRTTLLGWRALYFTEGVYQPGPHKSRQWNRGAYLVLGLGHCQACHTPRNALGAVKSDQNLRGGMISAQGWFAPDLGSDANGGLAGWSQQDIIDLLGTGRSSRGTAYGPMAEVVQNSLQYLRPDDLKAIAVYLHDLPTRKHASDRQARGIRPPPAVREKLLSMGHKIYHHECAGCHQDDGRGVPHVYPPLAGNSMVLAPNAVNPVRVVLLGGFGPTTKRYPRPYSMPPYMPRLSNVQIAAVISYIRATWGNHAGVVSPELVKKYRSIPPR
jgi:mono/diheme cytochrome c family protein